MLLLAALTACTSECGGPSCEHAWPASRLVVARTEDLGPDSALLALPDRLDGSLADGTGWSVAVAGELLVIGMPERSSVVIARRPDGIEPLADATLVRLDRPRSEEFGAALAVLDVDGDGEAELWVGAPGAEGDAGAVYRFPLDAIDGEGFTRRLVGASIADRFGEGLAPCGDVDGDGRADLAVSAPRFSAPDPDRWATVSEVPDLAGGVFLLRSSLVTTEPDASPWELGPVWWGALPGDGVGPAHCAADLTGDGLADLALGAPFAGDGDAGRVFVRDVGGLLSGPLTDTDPWTVLPTDAEAGWFGMALTTATFDGGAELVVGAPGFDGGRGKVAVYDGMDAGPGVAKPSATFTNPRGLPDHFGRELTAGDLDGDGRQDLVVGAPDWRERRGQGDARTRYDAGHLWVWSGVDRVRWTLDDVGIPADVEVRGTQPFLRIGRAVHVADLDGDGRVELLLPARAPEPDPR